MSIPSWVMGVFYSLGDARTLYSFGLECNALRYDFFFKCYKKNPKYMVTQNAGPRYSVTQLNIKRTLV